MRLTNTLALITCITLTLALSAQAQKPVAPAKNAPAAKTAQTPRTDDITGNDQMQYSLTTITAKPGELLRIRMISRGTMPKVAMAHNVVVLQPTVNIDKFLAAGAPHRATDFVAPEMKAMVIAQTPFAGPGEATQVVFTVPAKPGRYPYICTFAGHFQAGMKGVLIVK
jgi:azurin